MKWTVLGSGTIVPDWRRGSAAHALLGPKNTVLVDTGSGTKDRLSRFGIRLGSVSHILYSHAHLDHWSDLLALLFYRAHAPEADRYPHLTIAAPPGFCTMVQQVASLTYPGLIARNNDIQWLEVTPDVSAIETDWFTARPHRVVHGELEAVGWRFDGRDDQGSWSAAYSGDSGTCEALVSLARDVDCFVCECAVPDGSPFGNHMSPAQVRRIAEQARPRMLVLTHFYPDIVGQGLPGSAFEGYAGEIVVANDGTTVTFSSVELSHQG